MRVLFLNNVYPDKESVAVTEILLHRWKKVLFKAQSCKLSVELIRYTNDSRISKTSKNIATFFGFRVCVFKPDE